jgi:hypothetical protein
VSAHDNAGTAPLQRQTSTISLIVVAAGDVSSRSMYWVVM